MAESEVPQELSRLWRLSTGSRLGRPAELDVEKVVRAAVQLADSGGLAGVTLSSVAKSLGFTTMSLYRHVGSKDELFALMTDLVSGAPPELTVPAGQWREGLRKWAYALRARHADHPWLTQLPVSGPPSGPNAIGWMDAGLRAMRDTPLGWGARVGVITVLSGYVRSASQLTHDLAAGRSGTGLEQAEVEQAYGRALAQLVDPQRFPDAAQLFRSDLFESMPAQVEEQLETEDPDFVFGLELLLDGVAAVVDAASA